MSKTMIATTFQNCEIQTSTLVRGIKFLERSVLFDIKPGVILTTFVKQHALPELILSLIVCQPNRCARLDGSVLLEA